MRLERSTPTPEQLDDLVEDLATWQQDGLPVQLHPGDLGWYWRFGSTALAGALRVWTADGARVAIGFLDGTSLVRMAIAPSADDDEPLAERLVHDLTDPAQGVLAGPRRAVEARFGSAFRSRLYADGWVDGDAWPPLVRDLSDAVDDPGLRVEVVSTERVDDRVAVQRSAFTRSTFTAERWHEMSRTSTYRRARCLVGYDGEGRAVGAVTVWSAGPGRPGLLEPMGVAVDHRGHGYGTAICLAAATALREMGASSATVATESSNLLAIRTYASAGYRRLPHIPDFVR